MLVLIAVAVGGFLWWRSRRNRQRGGGLSLPTHEESIPLNSAIARRDRDGDEDEAPAFRPRKGKERAGTLQEEEAIFDVGNTSDDEDERSPMAKRD